MNQQIHLPKLLLCAGMGVLSLSSAIAAPIAITGAGSYTQDFNGLAIDNVNDLAVSPWDDDSTIPGWFLYRAGTNTTPIGFAGPGYSYYVADGNLAANTAPLAHNFYSMGLFGDTDRALGSCSTTSQGEQSAIVVFENTSGSIIDVSRLRYNIEVVRTNSGANNRETLYSWWTTAPDQGTLLTVTTGGVTAAVFPATTSSSPTTGSGYITGWNRVPELSIPYSNATVSLPVTDSIPVDASPATPIRVLPGHFLAIRWSNINEGGTDAIMGIDDLNLTFTSVGCAINASVSNVVRNLNGTPFIASDDTVDFRVSVTGTGAVNPAGWMIAGGPVAGNGVTYAAGFKDYTGVPIAAFGATGTLTVNVQDRTALAACQSSATVTVEAIEAALTATSGPRSIFFQEPDAGAANFARGEASAELGWTNAGGRVVLQPELTPASVKFLDINNSAANDFTTERLNVSSVTNVKVAIDVAAYTTSGTTFEDDDTSSITVESSISGDFTDAVTLATLQDLSITGTALFTEINIDRTGIFGTGGINYATGLYPTVPFTYVTRSATFDTDGANYIRLRVAGSNNSGSEHLVLDNICFSHVPEDFDGDAMADAWEIANFGSTTAKDGTADSDLDGATDREEYIAGTNPNNRASSLQLISDTLGSNGLSLVWSSVPGKTYRILTSRDLATWADAGVVIPAAAGATTSTDLALGTLPPGRIFVKVVVK